MTYMAASEIEEIDKSSSRFRQIAKRIIIIVQFRSQCFRLEVAGNCLEKQFGIRFQ